MIRPTIFNDEPEIVAGFTTRAFVGVAEEPEASRRRLADRFRFAAVASAAQVHGNNVAVVHGPGHVPACDGLVTAQPGLLLTVASADCALVLLADSESGMVGACHSGWRGTLGGVALNTVRTMEGLGARSQRIRAYVSPCISANSFEVGEEVAEQFAPAAVVRNPEWPRPHVDLKAELVRQLQSAGLLEAHIQIDPACTASDIRRFYSYRAEGGTSGRMIGFIGLRVADVLVAASSR